MISLGFRPSTGIRAKLHLSNLIQSSNGLIKSHWTRFFQSSSLSFSDSQLITEPNRNEDELKLFRSFPTGRKFINLAQDLQQRSLALIRIENIQVDSSSNDHDQSNFNLSINSKSKTKLENQVDINKQHKSRRKIRKNFEEDPEFLFDRKRGKKHVMAALKQSKLNPNNSDLSEKIHLAQELDLNLRSDGRIKKILLSLEPPPPTSSTIPRPTLAQAQSSSISSSTSAVDKSVPQQSVPTLRNQNIKPIDEFIKIYMGPLVWSNPQVDISLIYNEDQSQPKINFWIKEKAQDGLPIPEETVMKEVMIDESMNRSHILQLILNAHKMENTV